jgi:N-ethylmaleimide reductase
LGAGGFTPITARKSLSKGNYDLIAFGRWFLSNPDLPERIKKGYELNVYDRDTFYGGNELGYTDYPDYKSAINSSKKRYKLISQSSIGRSLS